MEAFDFAVGLGPVEAGAFVGDAQAGEVGVGAVPERGGGLFCLVGQDFGVSRAVVVLQLWWPVCRSVMRWPPPSGRLPSFLTSTYTRSPGRSCS